MGSRVRRALLGGTGLDRPRAGGVQRLVRRQDEPGPPVLARPRPRRHSLLRPRRAADRRGPGHARGLLARADLVRLLGRRRQPRRRRLLLLHRAGARRPARPAARRRGVDGTPATARSRSCPTRRCALPRIRGRRSSPSSRAPTRRARAPPAGTPRASSPAGTRRPRSARGGARSGRPDAVARSGAGRRPAHQRRHPGRRHRPPTPTSSGTRAGAAASRRREPRWR